MPARAHAIYMQHTTSEIDISCALDCSQPLSICPSVESDQLWHLMEEPFQRCDAAGQRHVCGTSGAWEFKR